MNEGRDETWGRSGMAPGLQGRTGMITISGDDSYSGEGRTRDLARGLLVYAGRQNLTREGMGIGCPVAKTDGATLFSRWCRTDRISRNHIRKTFRIDTGMGWGISGELSPAITHAVATAVDLYMRNPALQPLLGFGVGIRRWSRIRPVWYGIDPVAEVLFDYHIGDWSIGVICRLRACRGGLPTIYLLNELGADSFQNGWHDGLPTPPPRGWEPIAGIPDTALYDPSRGLCFRIGPVEVRGDAEARLYWGREWDSELCWAGYEIEIRPTDGGAAGACCRYTISFDRQGAAA
jgi:hypothetical protein